MCAPGSSWFERPPTQVRARSSKVRGESPKDPVGCHQHSESHQAKIHHQGDEGQAHEAAHQNGQDCCQEVQLGTHQSARARTGDEKALLNSRVDPVRTVPITQKSNLKWLTPRCCSTVLHQTFIETDDVKGRLAGQSTTTVLNCAAQADIVRAFGLCRVVR
jgi:hypothetical protein